MTAWCACVHDVRPFENQLDRHMAHNLLWSLVLTSSQEWRVTNYASQTGLLSYKQAISDQETIGKATDGMLSWSARIAVLGTL